MTTKLTWGTFRPEDTQMTLWIYFRRLDGQATELTWGTCVKRTTGELILQVSVDTFKVFNPRAYILTCWWHHSVKLHHIITPSPVCVVRVTRLPSLTTGTVVLSSSGNSVAIVAMLLPRPGLLAGDYWNSDWHWQYCCIFLMLATADTLPWQSLAITLPPRQTAAFIRKKLGNCWD